MNGGYEGMLTLEIPEREGLNEATREFIYVKKCTLLMEHSLIAISKWESKWHKPFLDGEAHKLNEIQDYARCMCLNEKSVDPMVFKLLRPTEIMKIKNYIDDPMTGTTFGPSDDEKNTETMSSELIYYYMIANEVPFECEKWHLNRLLTLLRICGIKNKINDPSRPKRSQSELLTKYANMHAARKAKK